MTLPPDICSLPVGAGRRYRRMYLGMAAMTGLLLLGAAGLLLIVADPSARRHLFVVPLLVGVVLAVVALVPTVGAAVTGAIAVAGDTVRTRLLIRARQMALVGLVLGVAAGLATIILGAALALGGDLTALLLGLGVGAPLFSLATIPATIRTATQGVLADWSTRYAR